MHTIDRIQSLLRRTEVGRDRNGDIQDHRHVTGTSPNPRSSPAGVLQIGCDDSYCAPGAGGQFAGVLAGGVSDE